MCRAAGCSAPRTSPQAPKVPKVQPKPVIQQLAEATNTFTRTNLHELSDSYLIWADLPGKPFLVTAAWVQVILGETYRTFCIEWVCISSRVAHAIMARHPRTAAAHHP